jgi:crotonobetainyl-CoA:carnitine CoA-transferase CaiB-like acyl-CoA transferase
MAGPLAGIRILDLSQVVAGPLATMMLAEQGAEVFKVEPPGGETVRLGDPESLVGLFANNNRGKRCVSMDLAQEGASALLLDMAKTCDVFVENFRPGVAGRLGLSYGAVRAANPDIIYCSINGFGNDGPYADRPALDPVIQALTGMVAGQASMSLPFPDLIRTLVADKATAYTAAQAITAALFARDRGAGGQKLDLAMLDAAMAYFWPDGMSDMTHPDDPSAAPLRACDLYQLVDTLDGKVVYFIATQRQLEGIWRALDKHDYLEDPDYNDIRMFGANPEKAIAASMMINEMIGSFTTTDIVDRMAVNEIPCAPVLERSEVILDAQVAHNETLVEWSHPTLGRVRQPRPAVHFSETPSPIRTSIGTTGEHTDEVLAEFGHGADAIARLRDDGVVA